MNGPEKKDTDFSWREFINRNNAELLGAYGNLVNRNLVFAKKYFDNKVPNGKVDEKIKINIEKLYKSVGADIEKGDLKAAIEEIFEFVRSINKYFDENTPWITVNTNKDNCGNIIYNCIFAIANISNLLNPFLPESSEKIKWWLGTACSGWEVVNLNCGGTIGAFEILFQRIDQKVIDEEKNNLGTMVTK